jgi:P21-Rho-binding domain
MFCEGDKSLAKMRRVKSIKSVFQKRKGSLNITPILGEEIREIGTPTGFKHNCHVGYDNGEFVGLPPAWNLWLQTSNITCVLSFVFLDAGG